MRKALIAIIRFCSDAAHLRALAIVAALVASHFGLEALSADSLEPIIALVISALGAIWTPGDRSE
jgi:hypothetical protein